MTFDPTSLLADIFFYLLAERLLKMSLEELRDFLQERIAQTFFHGDDVIIEQLQASMMELRKMKLDLPPPGTMSHLKALRHQPGLSVSFMFGPFPGKPEELPRQLLGQELPVQPSSAAGLSLHIMSHQLESVSPDQSPSKDPRDLDAPLDSPHPIIVHSQVPLTPDGSPLTGPPPYQPPGGVLGTPSAPVALAASPALSLATPECLSTSESTEDQELDSTLSFDRDQGKKPPPNAL